MSEEIVGLIPAAGEGTRLYPFSRAVPKEMYPILGKAVIEHAVENLKKAGIEKIFITVGHQKGAIMDYIGDGSFYDVKVSYLYQLKRKGLGHAVLQAKEWIDTTFTVLLGDSFIEPKSEARNLIKIHNKEKPVATILLFRVKDPTTYGIAKMKDMKDHYGIITNLIEKPTLEQAADYKINGDYYAICGMYVFEPKIFDYIEKTKTDKKGEIQLTDAIMNAIRNGEKVVGVVLRGAYMDIGKWQTVLNVEKYMLKMNRINNIVREREKVMKNVMDLNKKGG